jgi:hypothetical protein
MQLNSISTDHNTLTPILSTYLILIALYYTYTPVIFVNTTSETTNYPGIPFTILQ